MTLLIWPMAATAPLVSRLDGLDLAADVLRGFGRLLGQFLDFVGYYRKPLAGFAGTRRLDGGVQRQQIGLLGDRSDDFDHLPDLGAALAQLADGFVGGLSRLHRRRRHPGGIGRVLGNLLDAGAHLVGAGGHGLHVGGNLLGGSRDHIGLGSRLVRTGAHLLADFVEFLGRRNQSIGVGPDLLHGAAHLRAPAH